jgi:hypothetical protein
MSKPMWRVMFSARCSTMDDENIVSNARACAAAELRAIADVLEDRWCVGYLSDNPGEILAWLRAEADRAEEDEE